MCGNLCPLTYIPYIDTAFVVAGGEDGFKVRVETHRAIRDERGATTKLVNHDGLHKTYRHTSI